MLVLGALTLAPTGGHAFTSVSIETSVYEWTDEAAPVAVAAPSIASFGPFQVVAPDRVELNGSIESDTPAQFKAMLQRYPSIRQIDMIDCPGTDDDEANLALARMVRKAGIATYVPDGGSVRSGGVELFLAGAKRSAGARTRNSPCTAGSMRTGLSLMTMPSSDPVNQEYVDYYREIGHECEEQAKAFYALTNSVPHDDALYLKSRTIIAAYFPLD